jgi:hypothetical protein
MPAAVLYKAALRRRGWNLNDAGKSSLKLTQGLQSQNQRRTGAPCAVNHTGSKCNAKRLPAAAGQLPRPAAAFNALSDNLPALMMKASPAGTRASNTHGVACCLRRASMQPQWPQRCAAMYVLCGHTRRKCFRAVLACCGASVAALSDRSVGFLFICMNGKM